MGVDTSVQSPVVARAVRELAADLGLEPARVERALEAGGSWSTVDALFANEALKRRARPESHRTASQDKYRGHNTVLHCI